MEAFADKRTGGAKVSVTLLQFQPSSASMRDWIVSSSCASVARSMPEMQLLELIEPFADGFEDGPRREIGLLCESDRDESCCCCTAVVNLSIGRVLSEATTCQCHFSR